jgi:hypothetical protein
MANRIFYGSLAVFLNSISKNSSITNYFLSGVQSIGIDTGMEMANISNVGKTQLYDSLRLPPNNEITIERVLSNKDIFWAELGSNFLCNTARNSLTYANTFFLKPEIFGSSINGWDVGQANNVKAKNIPEYDLTLVATDETSLLGEVSGNSGTAQDIISMPKCLLTNLSYNLDVSGFFTENISLSNKIKTKQASNSFNLDSLTIDNPINDPIILKRGSVYNHFCVLPESIKALTDFNNFFNGQEIFGIKNIKIDLSLEYMDYLTTGQIQQGDKVNWHKTLALPVGVTCSFTISARRLPQVDIDPVNSDFITNHNERICIVAGIPLPSGQTKFFIWNLGNKNKMISFNQTGGSADGSIVEYEISYQNNNNDFLTYTQIQASNASLNPALFAQTSESY